MYIAIAVYIATYIYCSSQNTQLMAKYVIHTYVCGNALFIN